MNISTCSDFMVSTRCMTYNQEQFIVDTMNGFVAQQITFPALFIIVDDGSTDQTAIKIQQFLNENFDSISTENDSFGKVAHARHKDNKNCFFTVILLNENHYSIKKSKYPYIKPWEKDCKYIAFCEGDDFWTNPHKLQKQVDFLETNPDYNLACHNWNVLKDDEVLPSPVNGLYTKPISFTFATLPWVWITKTLTMMYRKSSVDQDSFSKFKYSRDVHIVYYALTEGKGYYSPEIMATYRVVDSGIWSKVDQNKKNFTTYDLYKDLYHHEPNKAVRKRYMNATLAYFNGLAFGKHTWHHIGTNARLYFEALRNVSDAKDLVFCLGGLVPTAFVKWVMRTFKI